MFETIAHAQTFVKHPDKRGTYIGSEELINKKQRYCLWLVDCAPDVLRRMPNILSRVEKVRQFRLASAKAPTRELASTPAVFSEMRQPSTAYLAVPEVSSENRAYIPIGFLPASVIASNLLYTVENAAIFHFGILSSAMHMAWVRSVCGRLESRYRYSAGIVYNNFPWPQAETPKQRQAIEAAAQVVLDARTKYPDSSLADLYDPLTMPADLVEAHHKLDAAVDAAYSKKNFSGDRDRADRRVDAGNLIQGGQTGATLLTTIVTLDPIHFVFDASEADYLRYARLSAQGQRRSSRDVKNPVTVRLADETEWKHAGVMDFVDNQLNARSGTIRGRAIFDNKDLFLLPGTFGHLRLFGGTVAALLIPDSAIVSDQASKVVFTVTPENKIAVKQVQLGQIHEGLRVVLSGLDQNDQVVIDGLANPFVRPGVLVTPHDGIIAAAAN